jgi:hypothetical protein
MIFNKRLISNDGIFTCSPCPSSLLRLETGHVLCVINRGFEFRCVVTYCHLLLTRTLFVPVYYSIAVHMRDTEYVPAILNLPSYTFEGALHELQPCTMLWE